jgi:pimeloyl-ACP methyl ester carboxylesterase
MDAKTNTLPVPGATLYYEVRGAGPVLLLICGGVYDASGFDDLAGALADRYSVVTYDRRGNSRSALDGPPEAQHIEVHADDAFAVLTAVGVTAAAPAYVFGNSSGAIIGLALAERHPEAVRTLVAHEPPLFKVLPDRDYWKTVMQAVKDGFAQGGAGAGMAALDAGFINAPPIEGYDKAPAEAQSAEEERALGPQPEPDPEVMARMQRNMEFFIGYEVPTFDEYTPDLAALRTGPVRIVAAVGAGSLGGPAYARAALVVAGEVGTPAAVFAGDHGGFGTEYQPFAATLHEVLAG